MEIIVTNDKKFLKQIPHLPGVYRFYDAAGHNAELLYIGKALDLFKRVKSYFYKTSQQSPRINLMVSKVVKIEITITENEASALILENNLIKRLKPKYNILFRDDKSYPLIRISAHQFSRIDTYRGKTNQKLYRYFGPYTNAEAATQAINLVQKLFKLRTCSDSMFANRSRPCMLYQVKLCTAPCVAYVTELEYQQQINMAVQFLLGNYGEVVQDLTLQMNEKAQNMEFEAAAALRDRIVLLNSISQKQVISNHNQPLTADVIFAKSELQHVYVYVISLQNGMYAGDKHFILDDPDVNIAGVIEVFIQSYYLEHTYTKLIYVQTECQIKLNREFEQMFYAATKIRINYVHSVFLKKVAAMAAANTERIIKNSRYSNDLTIAAARLAALLGIQYIERIECIDVSHNHGSNAVVGCVVYSNGKIDNNQYRRYNLPATVNGDDLAGMREFLERRLQAVDLPLPQVILIDGGKTQFNMLKNFVGTYGLYDKIKIASIFKGAGRNPKYDRAIINDSLIIEVEDEPVLFRLLQALRDEAHRFAITGHRKAQIKTMTASKLENIPNIGVAKRKCLLAHFGGIKGVMQASVDELRQVNGIGLVLAQQIYGYFHDG